jgi:putative glutamine amidotransferase
MEWLTVFSADSSRPSVYTRWLNAGGVMPQAITPHQAAPATDRFAALLLTGGVDVNPSRYGCVRAPEVKEVDDLRDALELELIRRFLDAGKPVFGICRGIQIVNVAMGGGLIQHLPRWQEDHHTSGEQHGNNGERDSEHPVELLEACRMGLALPGVTTVNSWHHQAADPDSIGRNLVVTARSPSGVVEALEGVGPFARISAVQWHPERLPFSHPASAPLLELWKRICEASNLRKPSCGTC